MAEFQEKKTVIIEKDESKEKKDEFPKTAGRAYALLAMSKLDQKKDKSEQEKEEHPTNFEDIRKKFEPNRKKNDNHRQEKGEPPKTFDKKQQKIEELPKTAGIGSSQYYSYEHEQKRDDFAKKSDKHGQEKNKSKNEQEEEDLPKTVRDMLNKFEQSTKITADLAKERDDILKKIDKYKQEEGGPQETLGILLKKLDDLQEQIDKNMLGKGEFHQTVVDLLKKIDTPREKMEELQKINEELRKEIGKRKAQFKSAWKNVPLFPDWRKEEFQAVNVFLDAATAHPALLLSENGRRVTWRERHRDLPSSPQRFDTLPCVLGQISITSGRWFWEVDIEHTGSWDLGVCRNDVTRKGRVTMSPQNGFWVIRLYNGEYWALTSPETPLSLRENPHTVGIFLDYEAGDVSFYNMTDGSHIFTFPQITFSGRLNPLFRLWASDSGPLTILQAN